MSLPRRPLIIVPARFSASASALRFEAEVVARKLVDAVHAAGGEPLVVHPADSELGVEDLDARFGWAAGVLLPGGGDLAPHWYDGVDHEELYDVDVTQDGFDLALAEWALATGRPLLAICRGLQVVNVRLGGTLSAPMDTPHRHVVSDLGLDENSGLARLLDTTRLTISCYHHQRLETLGRGLRAVATGMDGTIEAVESDCPGWLVGVQWHPEDTAASDPHQARIFEEFVAAARTGP